MREYLKSHICGLRIKAHLGTVLAPAVRLLLVPIEALYTLTVSFVSKGNVILSCDDGVTQTKKCILALD